MIQIDGLVRCGTRYVTFQGAIPNAPLEVTCELALERGVEADPHRFTININLNNWVGQPILFLSHFDQIQSLASQVRTLTAPRMQLLIQGNRVWSGQLRNQSSQVFENIRGTLEWLKKLRVIAEQFPINPHLPAFDSIPLDKWGAVEDLYDLIAKPQHNGVERLSITLTVSKTSAEVGIPTAPIVLRIDQPEQIFEIMGQKVQLGPLQLYYSDMLLKSCSPAEGGGSVLTFEGNERSQRIVKY